MEMNLESWVQGAGAALLLIPAATGIAYSATRRVLKRQPQGHVRESTLLPEVGNALGEIESLLGEIHTTLEESVAKHAEQSSSESAVVKAGDEINEITDSIYGIVEEVRKLIDPVASNAQTAEQARLPFPVVLSELAMFDGSRRARIFFRTGPTFDTSGQAYTLKVVGNKGAQELTFASDTAQRDIISAINQFRKSTGVAALQGTSGLVRLTSIRKGAHYFVGAKRISGSRDGLLLNEWKRRPANRQIDFGE